MSSTDEQGKRPLADMFGVRVDLLDMDQTVERCEQLIRRRTHAQHVVLNAGKVALMKRDPRLRQVVHSCDVVNADGQSIVWAGRLLGAAVPERVTGIDLMERLLASAEAHGWPVYFLGATQDVLDAFTRRVRTQFPSIRIAGAADGYFDDDAAAARDVAESGARILFVAMPSPRKEFFLAEQKHHLGHVFAMGVGGSFDVWAGLTQRAPVWMQTHGLEWFFRFAQEPRRMWKRYLVGNLVFLSLLTAEYASRLHGRVLAPNALPGTATRDLRF